MAARHRITRTVTGALLAAALVGGLAACGGGDGTAAQPAASSTFNDADVTFAQGMLPHHVQALEMAALATSRAANPGVKKLAATITAGQQPEILELRGLLARWGRSLDPSMESMTGMESMQGMPGMETMQGMANLDATMAGMAASSEITALRAAKGKKFDQLFLQMMLEHHMGAVEMAQAEQANGQDQEATALAEEIETAQSAEIARMQKLQKA